MPASFAPQCYENIISFTIRSAIFTVSTSMSILNINSPTYPHIITAGTASASTAGGDAANTEKNKPVIKPVYVFLQILNFLKITSVILNCNNCNCFSILINTKNSNIIIYDKLPISFFSITSLQTPLMRLQKCIQLQNRRF